MVKNGITDPANTATRAPVRKSQNDIAPTNLNQSRVCPAQDQCRGVEEIRSLNMEIVPFNFESHEVRTVVIDNEVYFVAKDVALALGYADALNAIKRHCKGVAKHHPLYTAGGTQEVRVIAESDVMRLIVSSKLPAAEAFERLVFEDILPTIRKTGGYLAQPALTEEEIVQQALAITTRRVAALEAKVEADAHNVAYMDRYVADSDLRVLRNVAKSIGVQEKTLRDALMAHKWIYCEQSERWSEKKQEKETIKRYSAYAEKRDYFRPVPVHDAPRFRGEVMHTLKVTPEGAVAIAKAAKRWGISGDGDEEFLIDEVA